MQIIVKDIENEYKGYITLANINNKLRELSYKVKEDCNIKFIDTTNADGSRVYSRTMSFIFIMSYSIKLELRLNILYQGDFIVKFIQIQNFKILI